MEIDPGWVPIIIWGVIGALVGFLGNFALQYRKEKKEIKALRILLQNEIDHNMWMIESIHGAILSEKFVGNENEGIGGSQCSY